MTSKARMGLETLFNMYSKCQTKSQLDLSFQSANFMSLGAFLKFVMDFKLTEFNPCLNDKYGESLPRIFLNISKYDKAHLKLISIYKKRVSGFYGIDFQAFKLVLQDLATYNRNCEAGSEQKLLQELFQFVGVDENKRPRRKDEEEEVLISLSSAHEDYLEEHQPDQ
jgi:hypothetical protein